MVYNVSVIISDAVRPPVQDREEVHLVKAESDASQRSLIADAFTIHRSGRS